MNTNSNTYTVIYTTLVCVLVAAILAFVSQSLKPKQEANEKAETISQILTAAGFADKAKWQEIGNAKTIEYYKDNIEASFTINGEGEKVDELDKESATVFSTSELKVQNRAVKKGEEVTLPVYVFSNGVTVFPIYGAGLWGPVWGYISFDESLEKIVGAYFDHESETPGLGGKIKDDPSFRASLAGKSVDFDDVKPFHIIKGGAPEGKANAIDAITGATMTSKGLGEAVNVWLEAYKPYFEASKCKCCPSESEEEPCCEEAPATQTNE